jgi:tRNA dimethylallyltransferase
MEVVSSMNTVLHIITGPTASGKTGLAHGLALTHNLPIISADSMQIYGDAPIATAAPTPDQLVEVEYHLIGISPITARFSAQQFLEAVQKVVRQNDGPILVVGGTGFYLQTLVAGLFERPSIPPEYKQQVQEEMEQLGVEQCYKRLQYLDPEGAKTMHPNDSARVARALEMFHATGKSITEHWKEEQSAAQQPDLPLGRKVVLMPEREVLRERIDRRAGEMLEEGLLEEVYAMSQKYSLEELENVSRALGVGEFLEVMARYPMNTPDEIPAEEWRHPLERMQATSRQYAKRQTTWLRKFSPPSDDCRWLDPLAQDANALFHEIEAFLGLE